MQKGCILFFFTVVCFLAQARTSSLCVELLYNPNIVQVRRELNEAGTKFKGAVANVEIARAEAREKVLTSFLIPLEDIQRSKRPLFKALEINEIRDLLNPTFIIYSRIRSAHRAKYRDRPTTPALTLEMLRQRWRAETQQLIQEHAGGELGEKGVDAFS